LIVAVAAAQNDGNSLASTPPPRVMANLAGQVGAKDEFQASSHQDRWRLPPDGITALREAANARGRALAATGTTTPPDAGSALLQTEIVEAPPGLTADDETKMLRWYEQQIPLLVGRASANRRLRRNHKVSATATILIKRFYLSHSMLEREPLAHTLAAVFLAAKAEDEFVSGGELATAVVDSAEEAKRLSDRAARAESAILSGVGYDLRVAHPHGPARALFDSVGNDEDKDVKKEKKPKVAPKLEDGVREQRNRIMDECDKFLTTDAPLLHAPSILAAAACLRTTGPVTPQQLQAVFLAKFAPEALDVIRALAQTEEPPEDAAALKKVRKRLKKMALWRAAPAKRPVSDATPIEPAAKQAKRGAAPEPGAYVEVDHSRPL